MSAQHCLATWALASCWHQHAHSWINAAVQGMERDDFHYRTREAFQGVEGVSFFSPAEICMLTHRILYSIKVLP